MSTVTAITGVDTQRDGERSEQIQKQLELEEEAVTYGIKKYRELVRKRPETELPPGLALMMRAIEPMAKAIDRFKADDKRGGRLAHIRRYFRLFDSHELAYITARRLINGISAVEPVQRVAISLATQAHDHLEYLKFKEEEPGYLAALERNLKTSHERHRRTVIMMAKRKLEIEDDEWPQRTRFAIGAKLIDLFIQSTGLVKRDKDHRGNHILQGTDETLSWLENHHAKAELLSPLYFPMVVKPVPWTTIYGGGFLTNQITARIKLVKTRNRTVLNDLENWDMPKVYRAVNAVQETPWRINRQLLEVMKEATDVGSGIAGLPTKGLEPIPPAPWSDDEEFERMKEEQPDVVKDWKAKAAEIYRRRKINKTKLFVQKQRLYMADRVVNEPRIYFVWTLDWRGRMYPMQPFLNPQAEDVGRALIEFAEGKPLGKRGAYWLAVQLANKFGEDKVSFDDRVKWVEEHERLILDSASYPLEGQRFWTEADDPWQFLAACFEWKGYKEQGEGFVSHLSIAMDGSCNGLQNYSAMLRDEIGGAATNLVPQDKPADVYQEVVDVVNKIVEDEANKGEEMAQAWLGKIDRKLAKRNVMTVPYGSKVYGMKEQIKEELMKRNDELGRRYLGIDKDWSAAQYLGTKMYEATGQVIVAARRVMDWLQGVAKIASKADKPIRWVAPSGFLVHQEYVKQRTKRIESYWGGIRLQLSLQEDTDKIDSRKQQNSIAPNFVHSMDASHLVLTINRCLDEGINSFSMVHDSFATHAADTDRLAGILREVFVDMYRGDVLEDFKEQLVKQLPEDAVKEIPPVPSKGSLDLEKVKESRYFFA